MPVSAVAGLLPNAVSTLNSVRDARTHLANLTEMVRT
jgi:hypothetical protein